MSYIYKYQALLFLYNGPPDIVDGIVKSNLFQNIGIHARSLSQPISPEQNEMQDLYAVYFDPRLFGTNNDLIDLQRLTILASSVRRLVLVSSRHLDASHMRDLSHKLKNVYIIALHHPYHPSFTATAIPIAHLLNSTHTGIYPYSSHHTASPLLLSDMYNTIKEILFGYPPQKTIMYTGNMHTTFGEISENAGIPRSLMGLKISDPESTPTQEIERIPSAFSVLKTPTAIVSDPTPPPSDKKHPTHTTSKLQKNFPWLYVLLGIFISLSMVVLSFSIPLAAFTHINYVSKKLNLPPQYITVSMEVLYPLVDKQIDLLAYYAPSYTRNWHIRVDQERQFALKQHTTSLLNQYSSLLAGKVLGSVDADPHTALVKSSGLIRDLEFIASQGNKQSFLQAKGLLNLYGELVNSNKSLAIILLNDAELRSTGGLIEAIGITNLNHGELGVIDWHNPVELDQRTNGQVVPPDDLSQMLRTKTWYIRDANWDVSSTKSGDKINWFLQKQLNITPDYTIVITASGLASLIGDQVIEVGDKLVNSDNMYYHLAQAAVAGEKNFLEQVFTQMHSHIKNREGEWSNWHTLPDLILRKQIYITSSLETTLLSQYELDGDLPSISCADTGCHPDVLYLVDSNIGINQVNPFLEKSRQHHLVLSPTQVNHHHQLLIQNNAPDDDFPFGDYHHYVRVVVPVNAKNVSIETNQNTVDSNNWLIDLEDEYKIIGFRSKVDRGETSTIDISYTIPRTTNTDTYQFIVVDQPGTPSETLNLSLSGLSGQERTVVNNQVVDGETSLVLDGNTTLQVAF
jgi:hypothetical protein